MYLQACKGGSLCASLCACMHVCPYMCMCMSHGLTCVFVDALCSAKWAGGGECLISLDRQFCGSMPLGVGAHTRAGVPYSSFAYSGHKVEKSGSVWLLRDCAKANK